MTTGGLVVFAYNFPHRKTEDFVVRLFAHDIPVAAVLAADAVPLGIPPPAVRTKVRGGEPLHPALLAARMGYDYAVAPHNDRETVARLRDMAPDLGVVAGARILATDVIAAFSIGILNFHPGLIPGARGLDALLWSIRKDIPPGVTAHLIDERVDAGALVARRPLRVLPDDTVFDLTTRLHDTQLDMLVPAIAAARAGRADPFGDVGPYHHKMPAELERDTLTLLPDYVARHAVDATG